MKRILSVFLLIAMTVSTFAILPAQAAAPITSTEEDSIVPSPWDSIETEGGAFSSEIEEAGLTYAAQGAETYGARSSSLPFRDVSSSSWFYDDVVYVYEAGLMDGISSTEFAPNASLTRAEVVTVLYRLDGSPAVDGGSAFTDVPDGAFYSKPVAWASQNGIVEGVGNHEFLPKKSITREQIATIFYRYYAGYLGNSAPSSSLSGYTDQGSVSGFAREPMAWAVYSGLIRGINASHEAPRLEPQSTSTRAQVATLIHRLDLLLEDESGCRSSQRIIDFIKEREGFSATPYWDHSQYTIGYGTYCGSSRDEVPASYWDGITRDEAEVLLHRLDLLLEDESGCRSSQRIIDFIKEREGFSATPYWDHSQYTIGYGTYCGSSRDEVPASYWDGITRDEAEVLLRESIASNYEASVIRYESGLGRRFTQGQFDALVSFTFNLGSGWMYDDCRLTRWLENPSTDLQLVWAMGVWCRAGAVNTHLCKRRIQESNIFLYGDYTGTGSHPNYCYTVYDGNGVLMGSRYDDVGYYVLGEAYGTLPTPNSDSYSFLGWYTRDGAQVTSASTVRADQTLTARWD